MKRLLLICLSFLLFIGFSFGNSMSVLINQKTSQNEDVFESSRLFEDGIINFLFDNGYIVSNEPVCLDTDYVKSYQIALDEAQKGYFDYLVVFNLYPNFENGNLKEADWSLIQVKTGKSIAKGKSIAPEIKTKTETEKIIRQFAEQNIREVLKYVQR